jgi:hypothetical protein
MSQTPCELGTWTCTGRLSATKSRMHSCVSLPVGPRHFTPAVVTPARHSFAGSNMTVEIARTPFWNLAVFGR